jgi:acetyl-CoA acyltransferase
MSSTGKRGQRVGAAHGPQSDSRPAHDQVFAPVVLAWAKDTRADLAKTNVNGGAIAIGHPLGASGARIMTTLVNALEQRGGRYGLQTMCEGGGMANATIIERLS